MINYDVTLKKKNGTFKNIKVCANNLTKAKKISLYWEDEGTLIEKIEKIN